MKVMLIDDEHHALHSLKRTLLETDPFLKISLVTNGKEALEQLGRDAQDVVITDLWLPGIDGVTLLEQVQKACPSAIRILVDGQRDDATLFKSMHIAHQVVRKPLDSKLLWSLICQTANLLPLVSDETMRKVLGSVSKLPAAPTLYRELSSLLQQTNFSIDDMVKLISRDPAITAKLLQLANSAFFTRRAKTVELRAAVVRLGINTIRNLLLGVELFEPGSSLSKAIGRELDTVQQNALNMAQMAERLARGTALAGDAFVAGLLADIGQVIFLITLGNQWRDCRSDAKLHARPLHEVEQEYFGVSHAEVGGYLLGLWGLPYSIVEAVANHHRPERIIAPLYSASAITAISAALIENTPIDDAWLLSMKAKTRVELLRENLAGMS
jgi:HD-like signal output (HDOD) protein/ActR/RegA family two-component response regulator